VRICFDARKIADFGIGQYIQNLLPALLGLNETFSLELLIHPHTPDGLVPRDDRVRTSLLRAKVYSVQEQFSLPWKASRLRPDVIHVPHYNIPVLARGPLVATVHDLIHLRFKGQVPSLLARTYPSAMFFLLAKRCRKMIAISECTANDLRMLAGADREKIETIPYGRDERFQPDKEEPCMDIPGVGPGQRVLLVVGNCKPHKNVEVVLDAIAGIPSPRDFKLVVAGGAFPDRSRVGARAVVNKVMEDVVLLGPVPHERLPGLYRRATALAFPSLYEGFGLPPLEAMCSGCPVLASTAASIPEVVGDAVWNLSPTDVSQWREAILEIMSNEARRRKLKEKGLEQAKRFSWARTAEETFRVYREAAGGGSR